MSPESFEAQDLIFQIDQTAAIETKLPEAARAMQQIEMRQARERRLARLRR